MHISLDSALGRQKRLNSVGESVLQIAPDAAAAYSLRSLTGGDPDVVRVRRESDNTEKDFSGSQIESGEMARWVNEQPTLPLDLRELDTNTGERDGALIEAAAAYSLRNLKASYTGDVVEVRRNVDGETEGFAADEVTDGTLEGFVNASFDDELPLDQATGASAAYSLRNLSSSYTGDVVQVRRSSDDAVQSFTASEVADGTLEDWVNADIDKLNLQAESGSLVGNVSNETSTGFDFSVNNEGSTGFKPLTASAEVGAGTYVATFDVVLTSGSLSGITLASSLPFAQTSLVLGSNSVTLNPDETSGIYFRTEGTAVADVSITNITLTQTTADGHVRTWYDQSGSDNHAVQTDTAKQPKIVDGGSLVTGGINFDGVGQKLQTPTTSVLNIDGAKDKSIFAKGTFTASEDFVFLGNSPSTSGTAIRYRSLGGNARFEVQGGGVNGGSLLGADGAVYSSIFSGTQLSDSDVSSNGSITDATGTLSIDTANSVLSIGYISGGTGEGAGQLSEIIIYNSDQSTKRRAIEENIANHYDISLAAFSRDGTVSTWYDQSGSTPSNDAVQTDATKQPKIVENGSVLEDSAGNPEIDFDGTSHRFDIDFGSNLPQPNSIFMVHQSDSVLEADNEFFDEKDTTGQRTLLDVTTVGAERRYRILASTSLSSTNLQVTTDKNLVSAIYNGSNSSLSLNGDAFNFTNTVGGDSIARLSSIGFSEGTGGYYDGTMQEFIIYNSDQSDNRTAIEANIGEHYGITAIPAANDTVNGYVQTWYDQSGEGRNGEQDTAANQPKIVVNGVLQKDTDGNPYLKFEGSQYFRVYKNGSLSEGLLLPDIQNTFSVLVSSSTTAIDKFVCQANRSQDRYYLYNNKITIGDNQNIIDSPTINTKSVRSVTANFLGLFSLYLNSSLIGTKSYTGSVTGGDSTIGASYNGGSAYEGSIYELVFYRSDQSSNRPAIEANIANQYGITLS